MPAYKQKRIAEDYKLEKKQISILIRLRLLKIYEGHEVIYMPILRVQNDKQK